MQTKLISELIDLVLLDRLVVVENVVHDGVIKEVWSLRHNAYLLAEILESHRTNVLAVEQDGTFLRIIKSKY